MIKSGATQQRQLWRRIIKAYFANHPEYCVKEFYGLMIRHKLGIHSGKPRNAQYKKLARRKMAIIEGGRWILADDKEIKELGDTAARVIRG